MGKTIIIVHGRGWKPPKSVLSKMYIDALKHGIKRDFPKKTSSLEKVKFEFIYYGDYSNQLLNKTKSTKEQQSDTQDRLKTLEELKQRNKDQFTKEHYFKLPGYNPYFEALADSTGSLLSAIRLGKTLVPIVAPDMKEYWDFDSEFGTNVRTRMIKPLKEAMKRKDKIIIIAHSLGTMIAYDTLWKFSHMGEYRPYYENKKIDAFISTGSPMGDETVKQGLKGWPIKGKRRYPWNIQNWYNLNAEDDYIAYDQTLKDDFYEMLKHKLTNKIEDHRIYNMSVRKGKSSPHFALGYIIHPKMAQIIAKWL